MDMDTCRLEAVAIGTLIAVEFVPQEGDSFLAYTKEVQITPVLSKGSYRELREDTVVAAVKQTPDILLGYDLTLTDTCFNPRAFAAADGGEAALDGHAFSSYFAPAVFTAASRPGFGLRLYAAQKNEEGEDAGYLQLSFAGCTGCPASFSLSLGGFFLTSYTIRSRPDDTMQSMKIARLSSLPFEEV